MSVDVISDVMSGDVLWGDVMSVDVMSDIMSGDILLGDVKCDAMTQT